MADVVVAGGGVVGLAVARELAGRGARVVVCERGAPGGGATWASAGILSPTAPHEWEGALGAFNAAAIGAWPAWADALADETGVPSGLERRGELRVGAPGERFLVATERGAAAAGWACERVDAREVEPALAADGLDVLHLPGSAGVATDVFVRALLASCAARGVEVRTGAEVVHVASGVVELRGGERLACGTVVVATGAWVPAPLDPALVRPVLGESLIVRPGAGAGAPRVPIRSSAGSVVPRADGTAWLGTTVLDRGFQAAPSLGSVAAIAANATRLVPALRDAAFAEARSGLRPVSADGLPLLGPAREAEPRLVLATGHGREGIIHAPPTATLLADGVLDGAWAAIPPALRAAR